MKVDDRSGKSDRRIIYRNCYLDNHKNDYIRGV
jgi:hypothetical protein